MDSSRPHGSACPTDRETGQLRAHGAPTHRRGFIGRSSALLMTGGLAAGYGTFFAMAGRYLYPSEAGRAWLFVTDLEGLEPGGSIPFESPTGVQVMITRRAESPPDLPPATEDFLALSSVCPHLGCRVHWEPHNTRFFCPCHNGVFDPQGEPVSGPPATANQALPKYPLRIVGEALFIEMPTTSV